MIGHTDIIEQAVKLADDVGDLLRQVAGVHDDDGATVGISESVAVFWSRRFAEFAAAEVVEGGEGDGLLDVRRGVRCLPSQPHHVEMSSSRDGPHAVHDMASPWRKRVARLEGESRDLESCSISRGRNGRARWNGEGVGDRHGVRAVDMGPGGRVFGGRVACCVGPLRRVPGGCWPSNHPQCDGTPTRPAVSAGGNAEATPL